MHHKASQLPTSLELTYFPPRHKQNKLTQASKLQAADVLHPSDALAQQTPQSWAGTAMA